MLDINFIKENKQKIEKACQDKNLNPEVVTKLLEIDDTRRELIVKVQNLRQEKNIFEKTIKGKPTEEQIKKGKKFKTELAKLEPTLREFEEKYNLAMLAIPNIPDETVPVGKDSSQNAVVKKWGDIPKFDFEPKNHIELGQKLGIIDFDRGVKLAGFRGYFLKNEAVLLHLGVVMMALERLTAKGLIAMVPPVLDKEFAFVNTGHFPWGKKEAYETTTGETKEDIRWLAGTAEVPLVSYHAGEILDEKDLPIAYAGFSPCFRREIGSYGKDTRGMYRIHEFLKVEQVVLCKNDWVQSGKWHENLLRNAEELVQLLELPYRVMLMCTGDMGEPQVKKYDIETWMPGRGEYGETMSDSNMGDFQSRRANIRYRTKEGKLEFVHMLNNTAIATPRILIAIMENYQTKEGWIKVPKVLQKYVGKDLIK